MNNMYRRIQGSNSPLSPLPRPTLYKSESSAGTSYFTPIQDKNQSSLHLTVSSCRSFTPRVHDITPPAVSPIDQFEQFLTRKSADVADKTFTVAGTPAKESNQKLKLIIPSPKLPHIIVTGHDASDSDTSIYYTPPSDSVVTEKVISEHRSAPKKQTTSIPEEFDAVKQLPMRSFSPRLMKVSSPSGSSTTTEDENNEEECNDGNITTFELEDKSILDHNINVETILKDLEMEQYIETFVREEIDLIAFCLLNINDLHDLKIAAEDVDAIMNAIALYADVLNISPESILG